MPLFENMDSGISSSQGSEESEVVPPPKRFCSGLSDFGSESSNQSRNLSWLSWESWDCKEVAEQLTQARLEDVAETFQSEILCVR